VIDDPALHAKKSRNPLVSVTAIACGKCDDVFSQSGFIVRSDGVASL
jgi:hypothetical protein